MGCDIHGTVEKKVGEKWVMVNRLYDEAIERNYARFAALAGVRGEGPKPKGLPQDMADSTRIYVEEWEGDGHSHSWLIIEEAAKIWMESDWGKDDFARSYPVVHYFNIEREIHPGEYRVVFWFDN